jgi:hypothetical protein
MLSALLSDPMLHMLSPLDLIKMRQLCKEARDVVENHRATQSYFVAEKESMYPWKEREHLYSLYPAVRNLTVELGGWQDTKMYLRSTIQTIHLSFPLEFTRLKDYNEWYLRNTWNFETPLTQLADYLEANPDAELHSVRFSFQPLVKFILEDAEDTCIDYDKGGPIYESNDVWVKTQSSSPEDYFWLVEPSQRTLEDISEALTRLAGLRRWKLFEIPEAFPGAKSCPHATLIGSAHYDEKDFESLEDYVYSLFDQKLNNPCCGEAGNTNGF